MKLVDHCYEVNDDGAYRVASIPQRYRVDEVIPRGLLGAPYTMRGTAYVATLEDAAELVAEYERQRRALPLMHCPWRVFDRVTRRCVRRAAA